MQPTIVFTAPVPGMIYINGRFAGEASRERPLMTPVSPGGAVYAEYRPLSGEGGMARRIVFSGGMPLAESLEAAEGLSCVLWPGGVLEAEFAPPFRGTERFSLEGLPCAIERGEETLLAINDLALPLPEGAQAPALTRLNGAALLLGDVAGGGQYAVTLTPDLSAQTGFLAAKRIDLADGNALSVLVELGDSVGHGRLEQWIADGAGLNLASSESVWCEGSPHWPDTAEATAIAAVEAALADLGGEADGYLSPALAASRPLDAVRESYALCLPMKYAMPDARPCVGLLKADGPRLARVRPLYYRAELSGGAQGPWQITWLSLE